MTKTVEFEHGKLTGEFEWDPTTQTLFAAWWDHMNTIDGADGDDDQEQWHITRAIALHRHVFMIYRHRTDEGLPVHFIVPWPWHVE